MDETLSATLLKIEFPTTSPFSTITLASSLSSLNMSAIFPRLAAINFAKSMCSSKKFFDTGELPSNFSKAPEITISLRSFLPFIDFVCCNIPVSSLLLLIKLIKSTLIFTKFLLSASITLF